MNREINNFYLANTIAHMKSVKDLDKRIINICVHLKSEYLFNELNMHMHDFVRSLCARNKLPFNKVPGLLSSLDFEGSRRGIVSDRIPHIHAMLILGELFSDDRVQAIMKELEDYLLKSELVDTSKKAGDAVYICRFYNRKEYKGTGEQITNIVDYNLKGKLSVQSISEVQIYPYEDIIQKGSEAATKIRRCADKHFDRLNKKDNLQDYFSRA